MLRLCHCKLQKKDGAIYLAAMAFTLSVLATFIFILLWRLGLEKTESAIQNW